MKNFKNFVKLITKAVSLAMGVAVTALLIMESITLGNAVLLLAIGLACAGLASLIRDETENNK